MALKLIPIYIVKKLITSDFCVDDILQQMIALHLIHNLRNSILRSVDSALFNDCPLIIKILLFF